MARVNVVLRTCGVVLVFIHLCLCYSLPAAPEVATFSLTQVSAPDTWQHDDGAQYAVVFKGSGFLGDTRWRLSPSPEHCPDGVGGSLQRVEASPDKYVGRLSLPAEWRGTVYFCLLHGGIWIHRGEKLSFVPRQRESLLSTGAPHLLDTVTENVENSDTSSSSQTSEITESDSVTNSDEVSESTSNIRDYIANNSFLKNFVDGEKDTESEQDMYNLEKSNYVNNDVRSVIASNGENVPGDIRMAVTIQSDLDKLGLLNVGIREPVLLDVSNEINDKTYKDEASREYLDTNDNFYGNLDEINYNTPESNWVDLSHDIDVNYYKGASVMHDKEKVPKDIYTFVKDKRRNEKIIDDDIKTINALSKKEETSKSGKENYEENTWKYFKESSDRIPSHWIDLSHDIDVNFPIPGSGFVLDVEGDDVEKNIFDKDSEKTNPSHSESEFEDILETSDVVTTTQKSTNLDSIETFMKRTDRSNEIINYEMAETLKDEFSEDADDNFSDDVQVKRRKREIDSNTRSPQSLDIKEIDGRNHIQPKTDQELEPLKILSIRIEYTDKEPSIEEDGVPQLAAGTSAILRIFAVGLTEDTLITFTHEPQVRGGPCQFPVTGIFTLEKESIVKRLDRDHFGTARVKITLPSADSSFYLCAKRPAPTVENSGASPELIPFVHQGTEPWLQLRTFDKLLPLWASLIIVCTCLTFSALFSGLNLGLMSLDRTELKILVNTGTEKEKEYAKVIQPVRDHGNYLLCSILLGNVAVNSTFTILLDGLTSGLVAVLCSTITIVLLGEITPQAICSRYGLAVGAKTIHVTKAVMVLTFPLSYPVSKLLDFLLGEEIGNVYNRERLKELVRVTNDINDLDKDEVNIISGALELRKKTVLEIMTKIEDVFMLDYEAVLDFETVSEIMKSGFSRIPVFENQRSNIIAILYVKDLAFVDPDDNTPLKTLCQFYQNPCNFVFEDVTLDVIFKQFKEGHKGHLAFVQRVNSEGEGDPFYETVGLATLEDVIEELIQAEIMDETDVFTDNKSKRRRNHPATKLQDFGVFAERRENQRIRISPQLTLATFQYLSTSVDAFKSDNVSETILRRLLKQDIIHHVKFRNKERQKLDPLTSIYEQGKPVDYFVLILEGRVEVTVGKENLMFESGPFTYFGSQALMQNVGIAESPVVPPSTLGSLQSINMDSMLRYTFIPDYSVRAITEVFYITVKRSLYMAAKRATLMERCSGNRHKGSEDAGEQFDDEVEKLLHSLEEEGSPITAARSPSHHLSNSRHASPLGPNGSIKTSRQSSPAKQAPVAQQEPEFIDTTPTVPQETSTLLPHS